MVIEKKHRAYLYLTCILLLFGTLQQSEASQQSNASVGEVSEGNELAVNAERQIALDIVTVLLQVKSKAPDTTTLHMRPPQDTFAANLGHLLDLSGYKVVLKNDINSANSIEYSISDKSTTQDTIKTYQINIGQLKLRRDYVISANIAQPQTAMFIQGANTAEIQLNDEIFNIASANNFEGIEKPTDRNHQPSVTLSVVTVDSKHQYVSGDSIKLSVSVNSDSKVYCYYKDGHGQIVKIFPNRFNTKNRLDASQRVVIPNNDNWSINATRIGATDDFLCVATDPGNESIVSALNSEPDLEPLAARSLDSISERISTDPNTPVVTTSLSIQVN